MKGKGYKIVAPPKDNGPEPLFRVIYTIDVDAPDAAVAARRAHQMMRSPDSLDPVFTVMDGRGHCATIDLSETCPSQ